MTDREIIIVRISPGFKRERQRLSSCESRSNKPPGVCPKRHSLGSHLYPQQCENRFTHAVLGNRFQLGTGLLENSHSAGCGDRTAHAERAIFPVGINGRIKKSALTSFLSTVYCGRGSEEHAGSGGNAMLNL